MRILYLTGRETTYMRNDVILRALRRIGEVDVAAPASRGGILSRTLRVFLSSLPKIRSSDYDFVFVGFFGQLLMLPVGRLARGPILFDAFLSAFDTLTGDRSQFSPNSTRGRAAHWIDTDSTRHADQILVDTPEQRDYFLAQFGLLPEKIHALPVGCNEDIFYPRRKAPGEAVRVLFYCTYLPLHGAESVVRAAAGFSSEPGISFRMIGAGPRFRPVSEIAQKLKMDNLQFVPPVGIRQLADEIAQADILLGGHFGTSDKAGRVIPGKIYQILAMAKPVIAGDTPANRSLLTHLEDAYLCPAGNPGALESAIRKLAGEKSLRVAMAQAGRKTYLQYASEEVITRKVLHIVEGLLD
ncbi:MAG: glycosyltransferase [Anaerolineales bacterium]|nr:glycosyltransferase [Anaerolineales bacterium]